MTKQVYITEWSRGYKVSDCKLTRMSITTRAFKIVKR